MTDHETKMADFAQSRLDRLDPALLQRRPAAERAVESPFRTCPNCGSTHFYVVQTVQLDKDTYSSSPGGDLSDISTTSFSVGMCFCGRPQESKVGGGLRSGRTANMGIGDFQKSIGLAIEAFDRAQQQLNPEGVQQIVAPMIAPLITPEEVDEKIAAATGNQTPAAPAKRK